MEFKNLVISFLLVLCVTSCVREEAFNAEADILTCTLPGDLLKAEPEIRNESVLLIMRKGVDLTKLAPEFTLTPGATINPASGTVRDFTIPQAYEVTSEDRNWRKTYTVTCIGSGISTEYNFEHISLEPKGERYQIFYDLLSNGEKMDWGSGNAGYALTGVAGSPEQYPTTQSSNGHRGKCARLETRSTGALGAMMKMYMAAGNLFIGTFESKDALANARKATRFGKPFENVPLYLTGYYKYKAGSDYFVGGQQVAGKKDQCDIYAIFYETDENVRYLDGTNALTSPNLISVARIKDQKETDEWTFFNLPFIALPGKMIDKEKLKKGGYQFAVICSSSIKGDLFEGALGSTLYVDEVTVIHAGDE